MVMSGAASEIEMQMQPVLSDLNRFLGLCVKKTQGKSEAPDFLLIRSSAEHKSGLTYFGQSEVENVASGVTKVKSQKRVRFKEPEDTEKWQKASTNQQTEETEDRMQLPTCRQETIANHQTQETEGHTAKLKHQLRIDVLSRRSSQHHDVAEGGEMTPRSKLNDMYKNVRSELSTSNIKLPPPGSSTDKLISDELDDGDTTPLPNHILAYSW